MNDKKVIISLFCDLVNDKKVIISLFCDLVNDKKVTIWQFCDLFSNYERQKGHNLMIMNDIVNDKKGHNFVNDKHFGL